MDTNNIIALAGLILAAIPLLIFINENIKRKKSPFTGIWEDEIYENGIIVKKDIFFLKQKGDLITGTAKRIFPDDQTERRYDIQGKIIGHDFVAFFGATNKIALSYGSWFLSQVNDTTFDGNYLKMTKQNCEQSPMIHLKLKRSNKSKKLYKAIE